MRLIGFWRGDRAPDWPDVERFVDASWDEQERDLVATYLGSGQVWRWSPGVSRCRFCEKPNGAATWTDGVYAWPEGLAHYVEEHQVRLPQEFVDHVLARLEAQDAAEVDETWWRAQSQIEV